MCPFRQHKIKSRVAFMDWCVRFAEERSCWFQGLHHVVFHGLHHVGFLLAVAMLSRVHRVYVRLVCRSDGFGSFLVGCHGVQEWACFWARFLATDLRPKTSKARLSGFTFLGADLCPGSGRKNGTTIVVPGARWGSATVGFVSIHLDAHPLSVHCTICDACVHLYENMLRLARNLTFCVCEWFRGMCGYFSFWWQTVVEVVPGAAILEKYSAFSGWCVVGL